MKNDKRQAITLSDRLSEISNKKDFPVKIGRSFLILATV